MREWWLRSFARANSFFLMLVHASSTKMCLETINTSFERTRNKQQYGTKITCTEVRGGGGGGGELWWLEMWYNLFECFKVLTSSYDIAQFWLGNTTSYSYTPYPAHTVSLTWQHYQLFIYTLSSTHCVFDLATLPAIHIHLIQHTLCLWLDNTTSYSYTPYPAHTVSLTWQHYQLFIYTLSSIHCVFDLATLPAIHIHLIQHTLCLWLGNTTSYSYTHYPAHTVSLTWQHYQLFIYTLSSTHCVFDLATLPAIHIHIIQHTLCLWLGNTTSYSYTYYPAYTVSLTWQHYQLFIYILSSTHYVFDIGNTTSYSYTPYPAHTVSLTWQHYQLFIYTLSSTHYVFDLATLPAIHIHLIQHTRCLWLGNTTSYSHTPYPAHTVSLTWQHYQLFIYTLSSIHGVFDIGNTTSYSYTPYPAHTVSLTWQHHQLFIYTLSSTHGVFDLATLPAIHIHLIQHTRCLWLGNTTSYSYTPYPAHTVSLTWQHYQLFIYTLSSTHCVFDLATLPAIHIHATHHTQVSLTWQHYQLFIYTLSSTHCVFDLATLPAIHIHAYPAHTVSLTWQHYQLFIYTLSSTHGVFDLTTLPAIHIHAYPAHTVSLTWQHYQLFIYTLSSTHCVFDLATLPAIHIHLIQHTLCLWLGNTTSYSYTPYPAHTVSLTWQHYQLFIYTLSSTHCVFDLATLPAIHIHLIQHTLCLWLATLPAIHIHLIQHTRYLWLGNTTSYSYTPYPAHTGVFDLATLPAIHIHLIQHTLCLWLGNTTSYSHTPYPAYTVSLTWQHYQLFIYTLSSTHCVFDLATLPAIHIHLIQHTRCLWLGNTTSYSHTPYPAHTVSLTWQHYQLFIYTLSSTHSVFDLATLPAIHIHLIQHTLCLWLGNTTSYSYTPYPAHTVSLTWQHYQLFIYTLSSTHWCLWLGNTTSYSYTPYPAHTGVFDLATLPAIHIHLIQHTLCLFDLATLPAIHIHLI